MTYLMFLSLLQSHFFWYYLYQNPVRIHHIYTDEYQSGIWPIGRTWICTQKRNPSIRRKNMQMILYMWITVNAHRSNLYQLDKKVHGCKQQVQFTNIFIPRHFSLFITIEPRQERKDLWKFFAMSSCNIQK